MFEVTEGDINFLPLDYPHCPSFCCVGKDCNLFSFFEAEVLARVVVLGCQHFHDGLSGFSSRVGWCEVLITGGKDFLLCTIVFVIGVKYGDDYY